VVMIGDPISNVPSKLCAYETAHTRKLGVQINVSSENVFAHYFLHFISHAD